MYLPMFNALYVDNEFKLPNIDVDVLFPLLINDNMSEPETFNYDNTVPTEVIKNLVSFKRTFNDGSTIIDTMAVNGELIYTDSKLIKDLLSVSDYGVSQLQLQTTKAFLHDVDTESDRVFKFDNKAFNYDTATPGDIAKLLVSFNYKTYDTLFATENKYLTTLKPFKYDLV